METVGVIAVVGACAPERRSYARRLAQRTNRVFFSASRLADVPDPIREAALLASWTNPDTGAVVELPDEVPATEVIGEFAGGDTRTRLLGLVCVVDAAHLIDDLYRDDSLPLRTGESADAAVHVARAQLTVAQIEFASTIVLVNWARLDPADFPVVRTLLAALAPRAALQVHRDVIEPVGRGAGYSLEQDRPGWMCLLNEDLPADHHARRGDRRVSALRYEQVRPLHPGRLGHLLQERIDSGEFGQVVRSAGFCRLATRPGLVGQWDQVGAVISISPLAADADLAQGDELLCLGQDLAVIGIDLHRERLVAALDRTALTEAEFAAGPSAWAQFADPFPAWPTATDRSE